MKEVETITEHLWPDKDDQPWYVRLFWADNGGRLICVGTEVRSARLPLRARDEMPAEHSDRLRRMASEAEAESGTERTKLSRDAACITLIDAQRGAIEEPIEELPMAELTADKLRRFGFGELVSSASVHREKWARLGARFDARQRARLDAAARRWRKSRERNPFGRPPLTAEFLGGVAKAYREAPRGERITAVREWARQLDPGRYGGGKEGAGVEPSTVNRWIAAARSPEMALLPPTARQAKRRGR